MKFRVFMSVIVLICVSSISSVALARDIKKGTVQISGDTTAGFQNSTFKVEGNEETKTSSIGLNLDILYYFVNNISFGVTAGYDRTEYEESSVTSKSTSIRIGPIVQLSVPINDVTNFYIGATAGYLSEEADDSYDASGTFFGGRAGISLFPAQSVSVDLGLTYLHESAQDDFSKLDATRNALKGSVGLSVYF